VPEGSNANAECSDTPGFSDGKNNTCSYWKNRDCSGGAEDDHYTPEEKLDVMMNCANSCGYCSTVYVKHENKNTWEDHGSSRNIDEHEDPVKKNITFEQCMALCTANTENDVCECVSFHRDSGECFRRHSCNASHPFHDGNGEWDVYTKSGTMPPTEAPTLVPTEAPSLVPTEKPTSQPSVDDSVETQESVEEEQDADAALPSCSISLVSLLISFVGVALSV